MNIKHIIAAVALMAMPHYAAAQQKDTTIVVGNRQIVVSGTDANTTVTVYGKEQKEMKKVSETRFVDGQDIEQVYVTSPFIPSSLGKKKGRIVNNYPWLYFGYNLLGSSAMSLSSGDNLPTRDAKSWEWGITLTSVGFRVHQNLALTSSLSVGQVFNHLKGNTVLATSDGKTSFATRPDDENVEKSYLMYDFVRLPVMLEWQKRLGLNAFVAVGPSLELRWHERSRYVVNGDKRTSASDINLNPVGLSLDLRAGYGAIVVYTRTALTPLLKTANAPKCYPVSIGMGIRF